ncbi:phosphatidylserine/phosphatidylglycerophosphate/cardiolipin synthase family protein [Sphingomonas sp. CL5.1]|uniref:phospholipase D-like domain-containing protein n=1 Tax=Sphingomonas sp. CL5.1 TaxID=2653203 RepID=UPI001583C66A|nr:phosphatidylserine/phosphatidylglycerophosphate/cardiolipin synthase family protein [Sphingomonas sp. CL5.1]QKS01936.1 phosphatidylserine/phosphatidylglycerophosphate/cardiolipin synthase family protein [Sphingomonas sp. CL5.1]
MGAMETFTVEGNRLTLLTEGPARLDALVALIDGARRSLRILYYIYADDESGRRVNEALLAAAARGVRVALIVDGFGSDAASRKHFFDPLEAAGIPVCWFAPRFGRRYLLRNHQKLALADEARIMIGGFNIANDYFAADEADAWRDLGLLVEGPAARRIARYFDALREWVLLPAGRTRHLGRVLARWSEPAGRVRWLIGGPTRRLSPWARAVRHDMRLAARIDIIAGYFTPSPTMLRRMDRAARRGDSVRIVTAARSDNNATVAAARFSYRGLLKQGVRIFEYQPSKLHTKLYAIDDAVHIGSANFDMRSLFINLELMLRIDDAAFAAYVRRYIDGEVARSIEITPEAYRAATGWWQRVKQFFAYLIVGVADPTLSRGLNFGIDD